MRRTALILAGAAAFDLGVLVVAAQAQQAQASPASGSTATGQAPGSSGSGPAAPAGIRGGFIIPAIAVRTNSEDTGDQSPEPTQATDGLKIEGVAGVRACSPGVAGTCRDPAPFDPSAPSGPPAAQTRAVDMFLKIDSVNTTRACVARRGAVVRHEGVQQCRLPGNPTRNLPGGTPRN